MEMNLVEVENDEKSAPNSGDKIAIEILWKVKLCFKIITPP